jgi:uncharacterized protein
VVSNASTEPARDGRRPPTPVKIVIAGGFGVGKTTAVASISEVLPLTTEAAMTSAATEVDASGSVPAKRTTTVALDFGCITLDDELKLYLFGTPGQDRFAFMWNDLVHGALGALVIVDSRRLDDCYAAVDYFEKAGLPFVVAVNLFDGAQSHHLDDIRWALAVGEDVPLIVFDARSKIDVRNALLTVLRTTRARAAGTVAATT